MIECRIRIKNQEMESAVEAGEEHEGILLNDLGVAASLTFRRDFVSGAKSRRSIEPAPTRSLHDRRAEICFGRADDPGVLLKN